MIKGIPVAVGDQTFIVPALTLGALERLADKIDTLGPGDAIDIVHTALGRNYPDLTRDQVAEMVDADNLSTFVAAAMARPVAAPAANATSAPDGARTPARRARRAP